MQLWETGLTRRWVEQEIPRADKFFNRNHKARTSIIQIAIKLEDLTSAFFIFGTGISLALLSFLMEILSGKFTYGKRHRGRRGRQGGIEDINYLS